MLWAGAVEGNWVGGGLIIKALIQLIKLMQLLQLIQFNAHLYTARQTAATTTIIDTTTATTTS